MKKEAAQSTVYQLIFLVILFGVLDSIFMYVYSNVDLLRATAVSLASLLILLIPKARKITGIKPINGFLAIYIATVFGALFVESGAIMARSVPWIAIRLAILVAAYILLTLVYGRKQ